MPDDEGVVLEDYTFCGPSMVFTNVMVALILMGPVPQSRALVQRGLRDLASGRSLRVFPALAAVLPGARADLEDLGPDRAGVVGAGSGIGSPDREVAGRSDGREARRHQRRQDADEDDHAHDAPAEDPGEDAWASLSFTPAGPDVLRERPAFWRDYRQFLTGLGEKDRLYFSFQIWQEGVPRFVEMAAAEAA